MKVKELLSYSRQPARARTRGDYAWKENGFACVIYDRAKRVRKWSVYICIPALFIYLGVNVGRLRLKQLANGQASLGAGCGSAWRVGERLSGGSRAQKALRQAPNVPRSP